MSDETKPHQADTDPQTVDETPVEPAAVSESDATPVEASAQAEDLAEPETDAVAAAPLAAAATSADKRPIWSDDGDAPFDDGENKTLNEKFPQPRRSEPAAKPKSAADETIEIIKTVVFALLLAFLVRVLLFQPFTIPSASMEPNLYEGDYIVVSKWSYGYSKYSSGLPINLPLGEGRVFGRAPERGDIAVFKLPSNNQTDYIKRVIGVPGDRVQMIANLLHINGQPVENVVVSREQVADIFGPRTVIGLRETLPNGRSYNIQDFGPGGELDDTPLYEVPAGHYFMMGDNRDNSIDSRVGQASGVGLVPEQNLVGKAQIIMFSWEPGASLINPVSWFSKLRPSRFFNKLN